MGLATLMTMAMLTSCHDDDMAQPKPVDPIGSWVVKVVTADGNDESMLYWRPSFESITVSIAGHSGSSPILVSVEDDSSNSTNDAWLTVASDTLAADSIIALKTTLNDTGQRRTATLRFTDADDPTITGTLELTQGSQSDNDSNGEDARSLLYVGYGYDIYKALESPMAVRCKAPIIDQNRLREHSTMSTYELIHDCRLSRIDMRYVSSNDLHAYGRDLTEQQTGDEEHPIEGCTNNCQMAVNNIDPEKGRLEQHNFGHGSLEKSVYSRVIDRAALMDLRAKGAMGFSDAFNNRLFPIYRAKGEERLKLIEQLLLEFGTHIVLQADLGGRIDYTFTMSKIGSFNTEEDMRQEVEYTMGRISDSDRTTTNRATSSSKAGTGAIVVSGGSEAARRALNNDISNLSPTKQIDPSHLTDWLASINYSSNLENDPNLDVIHFELMPVWDLVADELRQDFLNVTLRLSRRSDCKLPASFLQTDIYEFHPQTDKELFQFQNVTDQTSLCRMLYFEDEPVLQVCSEYVPKIRTDQRVTVVYPVYKQKIRMNEGLFLGDGIHQPAFVGFSGPDSYVNPIDSLPSGSLIEKFWYVNGSLALKNPSNVPNLTGIDRQVRDEAFYYLYDDQVARYPIVKIGSCYWTRRDIDVHMGFTSDPVSKRNRTDEHLVDGTLYARFYYDIGYYQNLDNGWLWGYDPNKDYANNPNLKWYMPEATDIKNLYAFLGFNPKALFKGQQSCFDAQFNGYYGVHDIIHNTSFGGNNAMHYKGEYCFLASRNTENREAVIMVLDTNYHLELKEARGGWSDDYYPIRAVRGWLYTYPKLSDIVKNTTL